LRGDEIICSLVFNQRSVSWDSYGVVGQISRTSFICPPIPATSHTPTLGVILTMDKELQLIENGIIPFPEISDVFIDDYENNQLCFLPLCSIDVSKIDPSKSGVFHFLNIWDSGDYNSKYFDIYRNQYWIRFSVKDNKYEFNGSYSSFPKFKSLKKWRTEVLKDFEENREEYLKPKTFSEYMDSGYKKKEEKRNTKGSEYSLYYKMTLSYLITKENFKRTGKLIQSLYFTNAFGYEERNFIDQIGGIARMPRYEMPVNKLGQTLNYIGKVTGWYYNEHGVDSIHLFYDREKKDAVQVFRFS